MSSPIPPSSQPSMANSPITQPVTQEVTSGSDGKREIGNKNTNPQLGDLKSPQARRPLNKWKISKMDSAPASEQAKSAGKNKVMERLEKAIE
ncbi:hypothetical protein [Endozoicomonas atrinae]|uniref:hypothetical protein n=1 Tax=Endozoicomonas atrinae TaxID=1333660 RepID=UPI0008259321|nr:hypothetical protein [Endozoicomonas atrinae]